MVELLLLLLYIKYNKYILKISWKGMSHECHISSFVLLWYVLYMDINDCVVWMLVQLCSRRRHEYPLTLHRLDLRSFCGFSKHSQSWDIVFGWVSYRSACGQWILAKHNYHKPRWERECQFCTWSQDVRPFLPFNLLKSLLFLWLWCTLLIWLHSNPNGIILSCLKSCYGHVVCVFWGVEHTLEHCETL